MALSKKGRAIVKKPRAVMLDVDGVLVVESHLFSERLHREHGIPKKDVLAFFENEFSDCVVGKADLRDRIRPYMRKWGWQAGVNHLMEYWFSSIMTDPRAIAFARKLRSGGTLCALASNQERHRAARLSEVLNAERDFDGFFHSAGLGARKPQKEFFGKAFALLEKRLPGLKKDEVLFWDDSAENVAAARRFGMRSEHYSSFPDFERKMESEYGF